MFPLTQVSMRKGVVGTKVKKRRFLSDDISAVMISTAPDVS
jgi:hypothetical protein